jgi:hypothetical protein
LELDALIKTGALMKLKYLFYGIAGILLLLILIAIVPIDDKLNAEAAAWVEAANDTADVESNGYYYLTGITAAPDQDPATAGKAFIDDYREAERKFRQGETAEFTQQEYPKVNTLPQPTGDYYCRLREAGCFTRLASNAGALRAELQTHAVLLQRYQRYLQFETVKPLVQPSLYEPISPYQYIVRGQRLRQFQIILDNLSGRRERALGLLHEDIRQARRQLVVSPNLIGKMIALNMLVDDLDLLAQLAPLNRGPALPPLTPQERSLDAAMRREFGYIANLLRQLDEHPGSLGGDRGFFENALERLAIAALKSNMSLNSLFPHYREIAELSKVEAAEFSRNAAVGLPEMKPEFQLRNIIGYILNSISVPQFAPYIARLHDVDCKIALVNGVLAGNISETPNPYNPDARPYMDEATQSLCFDGPLPDDQQRRCIRNRP